MDLLTHLFLPVTVAYAARPEWFRSPLSLGLAGFAVLPDFDKFLLSPGLLHSALTLTPVCAVVLLAEYYWRGELRVGALVAALVASHLLLDFVDGGPVFLLYPLVEQGIGLQYPARLVFGQGPLGLAVEGALVRLRTATPAVDNRTYGFLQGAGVASLLAFAGVVWGRGLPERDG